MKVKEGYCKSGIGSCHSDIEFFNPSQPSSGFYWNPHGDHQLKSPIPSRGDAPPFPKTLQVRVVGLPPSRSLDVFRGYVLVLNPSAQLSSPPPTSNLCTPTLSGEITLGSHATLTSHTLHISVGLSLDLSLPLLKSLLIVLVGLLTNIFLRFVDRPSRHFD